VRVLALEPYYGGSHRAFLDGWAAHSRHDFTPVTLPPHKWKWRMRHSAWTLAEQVETLTAEGGRWDCLFCSDMLNLAEFRGLAPAAVATLPAVAYFHENQITYPDDRRDTRDVHFGLTNMTTALAAEPWFNSAYHRDAFGAGLAELLEAMPDHQSLGRVDRIVERSRVLPPGIEPIPPRGPRRPGPMRIVWTARWERDKNPEAFFEAIGRLGANGVEFRLSVLGEQFGRVPEVFDIGAKKFAARIDHWGYLPRDQYIAALADADVAVSTATHEFFGVSLVEAAAAGAMPVVPKRLAYPEVFGLGRVRGAEDLFYDGDVDSLVATLAHVADRLDRTGAVWQAEPDFARDLVAGLQWPHHACVLDDALDAAAE